METFVMVTRLSPDAVESPEKIEELEAQVMERIRSECPQIKWTQNLTLLGPWDYLDTFEAPDVETAMKASTLVRTYGHAHTEVWPATEWKHYKKLVHELPKGKGNA
ncbi:MAG: GYD domain-containing protein [Deltaproteobacteria bacterium]|nr:GYD domain-containing protein [Deltaproteobacteria bacterium]